MKMCCHVLHRAPRGYHILLVVNAIINLHNCPDMFEEWPQSESGLRY